MRRGGGPRGAGGSSSRAPQPIGARRPSAAPGAETRVSRVEASLAGREGAARRHRFPEPPMERAPQQPRRAAR